MAKCIQCPSGKWICGDDVGEGDCQMAGPKKMRTASNGTYLGTFSLGFNVYVKGNPHKPGKQIVTIQPVNTTPRLVRRTRTRR